MPAGAGEGGGAPSPAGGAAEAAGTVAALETAVAGLGELGDLPVAAHVARYEALHGELSEALASIDGI